MTDDISLVLPKSHAMKTQERFSRGLLPNFYPGKPEAAITLWFVTATERKTP